MNWLTFAILSYLGFALQVLLMPFCDMIGFHEPIVLLVLLVFIGLQAPPIHVAWGAIVLGVLTDILMQQHEIGLIGPWAIGFLAAGYAMIQLRNLLFRDSMFTIGIMTLIAGIFALLVATMLQAFRGLPIFGNDAVEGFKAADQLFRGFWMLLTTAIFAVPVGYVLLQARQIWSFSGRGSR